MIENTEQLEQAIERMGRMQRILESYRSDILPKNPRNFAVFAEGPLDHAGGNPPSSPALLLNAPHEFLVGDGLHASAFHLSFTLPDFFV